MSNGEYITVDDMSFDIKKENFQNVVETIIANQDTLNISCENVYKDTKWATRIESTFSKAGWQPEFGEEGDIEFLQHLGDTINESDDLLFQAIAPYVLPQSYIQIHGEHDGGSIWQWRFNGHTCERHYVEYDFQGHGKIVDAILKRDDVATFIGIHEDLDKLIAEKLGDENHEVKPVFTAEMLLKSLDRKPNWNRTELVNELGLTIPEEYNW